MLSDHGADDAVRRACGRDVGNELRILCLDEVDPRRTARRKAGSPALSAKREDFLTVLRCGAISTPLIIKDVVKAYLAQVRNELSLPCHADGHTHGLGDPYAHRWRQNSDEFLSCGLRLEYLRGPIRRDQGACGTCMEALAAANAVGHIQLNTSSFGIHRVIAVPGVNKGRLFDGSNAKGIDVLGVPTGAGTRLAPYALVVVYLDAYIAVHAMDVVLWFRGHQDGVLVFSCTAQATMYFRE